MPPKTLNELSDSLALVSNLREELPNIRKKFPDITEEYRLLDKLEVRSTLH